MDAKIVTITGDLGSGKSSVAKILSSLWGAERYSAGMAQREMAQSKGISVLALNLLAENDPTIDQSIDAAYSAFQPPRTNLIIDARMAWHFLPDSLKIKLVVSPEVAARRVFLDSTRVSENSASEAEAFLSLMARRDSENKRYKKYYGVNAEDNEHFDFVIDTGAVTQQDVASLIHQLIVKDVARQKYWASPKNLFPTKDVLILGRDKSELLCGAVQMAAFDYDDPIQVARQGHNYFIHRGHKRISDAIIAETPLVPLELVDGRIDSVHIRYCDWEHAHKFVFDHYPKNHMRGKVKSTAHTLPARLQK